VCPKEKETLRELPPHILLHIAQILNVPLKGVVAVIQLLDDGGTVPFIARYRKEVTGNLDEVQIRSIEEKLAYFRELEDRRETILASIAEQGKLTAELKAKIEATLEKSELEDLYLPYRPKRRTKATIAKERGLEPLADYLWAQQTGTQSLNALAATFIDLEKGVASEADALEGARHIIAERISETASFRKALRDMMHAEGMIVSRRITDAPDPEEKFKMYYDFREPVKAIAGHRMLAIRRGENENVLFFTIELDAERALAHLKAGVIRRRLGSSTRARR
jgi:protein Tex